MCHSIYSESAGSKCCLNIQATNSSWRLAMNRLTQHHRNGLIFLHLNKKICCFLLYGWFARHVKDHAVNCRDVCNFAFLSHIFHNPRWLRPSGIVNHMWFINKIGNIEIVNCRIINLFCLICHKICYFSVLHEFLITNSQWIYRQ